MEEKLVKAENLLKKYGQEHILEGFNKLELEQKSILLNQILNTDFELIKKLYEDINKTNKSEKDEITPIEYIDKEKMSYEEKEKFKTIGEEVIKNGGLAVITMAGGQGTRLRI